VPSPMPPSATGSSRQPGCRAAGAAAQPVAVRTAGLEAHRPPEQFLFGGRLWLVRHAERLSRLSDQAERWRVRAGDGADGQVRIVELVRRPDGGWQLHGDQA